MEPTASQQMAAALMAAFATRTGLVGQRPPQRYLWTDAFAVCNFLGLARLTRDAEHQQRALELIHQVHHVLGRHRADSSSQGWLSGLDEAAGETHPTLGGLRIGKKHPERRPQEPFDERLEWDRDGQYFHYLTKWMHALDQAARAAAEPRFNLWARELAQVAHNAFVFKDPRSGQRRMAWKMSTDLSRPLVPSMGQHDPLDGFVTCVQLEATASRSPTPVAGPHLTTAMTDFWALLCKVDAVTEDPLGLGGLLSDAWRIAQLMPQSQFDGIPLLLDLLTAAQQGLLAARQNGEWTRPAAHRLAFRELGLAIGLWGLEQLQRHPLISGDGSENTPLRGSVKALARQLPLKDEIISFWARPEHQQSRTWLEHRDINEVMLATALEPDGYLLLGT